MLLMSLELWQRSIWCWLFFLQTGPFTAYSSLVYIFSYKVTNAIHKGRVLISSHRPCFLVLSYWELDFNVYILGRIQGLKQRTAAFPVCSIRWPDRKAVHISKKRKSVADVLFKAELSEFLTGELAEDGYSGVDVRVIPTRTKVIILATRIQKCSCGEGSSDQS